MHWNAACSWREGHETQYSRTASAPEVHSCTYNVNWGEPERAPHKRYSNVHNIWYMYGPWYVCHPHATS